MNLPIYKAMKGVHLINWLMTADPKGLNKINWRAKKAIGQLKPRSHEIARSPNRAIGHESRRCKTCRDY